ncbi:MAG: hypothetical protein Q8O35_12340 [Humidesulfovibrio sp.]|uniref:hypothetical protein n=1 Tax=Humidesulfovibrio sp. TaxID=2910988 RepID=UPI002735CEB2|nr:hypothetical protein [Humidesulfovibrio sp.]MDP2848959.1 hypothetical protein [Humidesulfovibrio sp.]
MTAAEQPICVSWRCPRKVECLAHACHRTFAEIVTAKESGRTVNLESTGDGCGEALPLLGVL